MTKKEKKSNDCCGVSMSEQDDYPYGTVISLNDDSMKKLGIKATDFKVGQNFTLTAKVTVKETRAVERNGKTEQSLELQITNLHMPKKKTASESFHDSKNAGPGEDY
jgi:hypothetical protein